VFRRQLLPALRLTAVLTVLLGLAYPLLITGFAAVAFRDRSEGSFIERDGVRVGSALIGQSFTDAAGNPLPQYFQSRPSAAGSGYDAMASNGSNLGPGNNDLLGAVEARAVSYRRFNGLEAGAPVPVDAVTASASGLDPHISLANARLQISRVAGTRGLDETRVAALVDDATTRRTLGFLGEPGVNVVRLNLALDSIPGRASEP
jgi:potassium-transporting ATPase KdpC subunit